MIIYFFLNIVFRVLLVGVRFLNSEVIDISVLFKLIFFPFFWSWPWSLFESLASTEPWHFLQMGFLVLKFFWVRFIQSLFDRLVWNQRGWARSIVVILLVERLLILIKDIWWKRVKSILMNIIFWTWVHLLDFFILLKIFGHFLIFGLLKPVDWALFLYLTLLTLTFYDR